MLLEIQVLGFHFLCPTVVSEVIDSTYDEEDVFGLRHDTLEGNIEAGTEWFVLKRNRKTGDIFFLIQAHWTPVESTSLWIRIGFNMLSGHYRRIWHTHAFERMNRKKEMPTPLLALAVGTMAGMRALSAPAFVSYVRLLPGRRIWESLALLELFADKLPFIPARTTPGPLLVRALSGAFSARSVVQSKRLFDQVGIMVLGGLSSIFTAACAYRLRKEIGKKLQVPDSFLGLAEDFLVMRAEIALRKRIA